MQGMLRLRGAMKFSAVIVALTVGAVVAILFANAKVGQIGMVIAIGAMLIVAFRFMHTSARNFQAHLNRRAASLDLDVRELKTRADAVSRHLKNDEARTREIGQMVKTGNSLHLEVARSLEDLKANLRSDDARTRQLGQTAQDSLTALRAIEQSSDLEQVLREQKLNEGRVRQLGQICNQSLKLLERLGEDDEASAQTEEEQRRALAEYRVAVLEELALVSEATKPSCHLGHVGAACTSTAHNE